MGRWDTEIRRTSAKIMAGDTEEREWILVVFLGRGVRVPGAQLNVVTEE